MSGGAELVTVYRSMDASAKDDCETLQDILQSRGIHAEIQSDSVRGVPEGAFQLAVSQADAARAEKIIAENPLADEVAEVDNSENLNLETIFRAEGGTLAELEAMGVKNLLEANGIAAVLVGDSVLPNLGFEVRVAREKVKSARELIADAQSAEPAE